MCLGIDSSIPPLLGVFDTRKQLRLTKRWFLTEALPAEPPCEHPPVHHDGIQLGITMVI